MEDRAVDREERGDPEEKIPNDIPSRPNDSEWGAAGVCVAGGML